MDHNCKYPRNPAAEFLRAALFLALASAVSFTSNSERSISYNLGVTCQHWVRLPLSHSLVLFQKAHIYQPRWLASQVLQKHYIHGMEYHSLKFTQLDSNSLPDTLWSTLGDKAYSSMGEQTCMETSEEKEQIDDCPKTPTPWMFFWVRQKKKGQ